MNFIYNDGGRVAAGFKGMAGDCVARAVAIASGKPYAEVYARLALVNAGYRGRTKHRAKGKLSARNGVFTSAASFDRYMEELGFKWTPTMTIGSGCKTHLRDGELPMGRLIVKVSKHLVAVIDGVMHDTFDCSRNGTRCVYGYWAKGDA